MVPSLTQSKALPLREDGGLCVLAPISHFRLRYVVVLGVRPTGQQCHLCPPSRLPWPKSLLGHPRSPMLVEFRGEGSSCLLSLSPLILFAVWMVLPSPTPCLWGPFVCLLLLLLFYINMPGPVPYPLSTHCS